ncbi:transposase [Mycobacterium sp. DL440]|uniref:transposase n=1 Tax=Mycobacterium sp. DL440 TaxID=2675523 RepID=UPI001AAF44B9
MTTPTYRPAQRVLAARPSGRRHEIPTGSVHRRHAHLLRNHQARRCDDPGSELVEFNGEASHLHLPVAYPPTLAISTLAQGSRATPPTRCVREYTGVCVRARMRGHLRSPSYFAVSCGGPPSSIIKQYIDSHARPL